MKINEIGISNFGKFHNKKIKLSKGLNLIVGNNESGKSTVFTFLFGMFYGFAKDSTKRRIFDENFEKYRPWLGTDYRGYLEVEDGNIFRIERDFNKNELSFINLSTGENISNSDELIKYTKIKQPGAYLFGVNSTVFLNSFFVGQLQTEPKQESYEALKEKIENFSTASDELVNPMKAISLIQEQLNTLGKQSLSKSEIGKLSSEIEKLKREIFILENEKSDYDDLLTEQEKLKKRQDFLKSEIGRAELIEDQKRYNEILEKKSEIADLLNKKSSDNLISYESYEKVIELEKKIYNIERKISELSMLGSSTSELNLDEEEELKKDFAHIQNLNNTLRELNAINYSKEIEFIRLDIKNVKNSSGKITSLISLSGVAIVLILIISIYFKKYYLNLISVGFGIYIYLRSIKIRMNLDVVNRLNTKVEDYEKKSSEKTLKKKELDILLDNLCKKYKVKDNVELEQFIDSKLKTLNENKLKTELLNSEIEKQKSELYTLDEELKKLKNEQDNIFKSYGIENISEFKDKFNEDLKIISVDTKIENLENIINLLLEGRDFEELNHKVQIEDIDTSSVKEEYRNIELELTRVKERISIVEVSIKKLEKFKEELSFKTKELDEKEKDKKSSEEAIELIREISKENKENILPLLRDSISDLLKKFTNSKYDNINIDSQFNISVYDSEVDKYVKTSELSNGTIDQIYLAFRISILNLLFENAPIVLDDHFIQYDDNRLESTIKYLNEISKSKQVIIFSATNREKMEMEKMNVEYNLVNMEQIWFGH